jgi:hypothetical protein
MTRLGLEMRISRTPCGPGTSIVVASLAMAATVLAARRLHHATPAPRSFRCPNGVPRLFNTQRNADWAAEEMGTGLQKQKRPRSRSGAFPYKLLLLGFFFCSDLGGLGVDSL